MSEYRVDLDIFAGPLDLLLYLVRKEEVDIYDIPISRITEQYIKYVEMLSILDIELAGDFLVMASALMEIKSAMLLPKVGEGDGIGDIDDPRSELVRQLLEYKKFKDAANILGESAELRCRRFNRPDTIVNGLKQDSEPQLDIDQISIWTLLEAFGAIMAATGRYAGYEHIRDDTPIDLYQIEILHRLQTEGAMTFENIFCQRCNRLVMIGLFLAMLELIRAGLIEVEQPKDLEVIYLRSLTDEPAEQAVRRIISAGTEAGGPVDNRQSRQDLAEGQEQLVEDLEEDSDKDGRQVHKPPIAIVELPPSDKDGVAPAEHGSRADDLTGRT